MRTFLAVAALAIFSIVAAQVDRKTAENTANNSNGVRMADREVFIWSLMASDQELIKALGNGTGDKARFAVTEALKRKRTPLTEAVAEALPRADQRVGLLIVGGLRHNRSSLAMRTLERAVSHPQKTVRWAAAVATADWRHKPARSTLIEAVKEDYLDAVRVLPRVAVPSDVTVLRAFLERAKGRRYPGWGPNPKELALLALAEMKDAKALAQLRKEVDHRTDRHLREQAVTVLGKLQLREDKGRILQALRDPALNVRLAAAEAVGQSGDTKAIPILREVAREPGPDAASAPTNDRMGRMYMEHVAEHLAKGTKPLALETWNRTEKPRLAIIRR